MMFGQASTPAKETEVEVLPCVVCGKPVQAGEWFFTASQAVQTMRQGSALNSLQQRPIHLTCVSPFPLRRPEG